MDGRLLGWCSMAVYQYFRTYLPPSSRLKIAALCSWYATKRQCGTGNQKTVICFERLFLLMVMFTLCPQSTKASDDLLQLSANPFADIFSAPTQATSVTAASATSDMWLSNG